LATTFKDRLTISLKSLGCSWLISGLIFCMIVKGPGTIWAWAIWGSGVFIAGWALIALPIVALGDRLLVVPLAGVTVVGGFAGALLMLSPNLAVRLASPRLHWAPFSLQDLTWPSLAFGIAAFATTLYCLLLKKSAGVANHKSGHRIS